LITRGLSARQGFPAQTIQGGIGLVTTEHAPITAPSPMMTPGPRNASAATHACELIFTGAETSGKWGWV
jgi:hypothetical protein